MMRDFSSLESLTLLSLFCCLLAYFWSHFFSLKNKLVGLPLPPGPKANFWGNVNLPRLRPWLAYASDEWRKIYGELIYIRVFGNPILVLNTATVVSDLLEKRSGKYSSRPVRTMIVDLIGWDWLVSAFPYGTWWQAHRIMLHRHLPANGSSVTWHPLQIQETHALCRRLLTSPKDFRNHVRKCAARIVLKMTYGPQVGEANDYVALADKALASLAEAGIFGTYLVDYIPFLKYAPVFFRFRRKALEWRKPVRAMLETPYAIVKDEMARGTASKCLVSEELERVSLAHVPSDEKIIKNVAATMYAAGADTVVSAISSLFLAMSIHPESQKRAQSELDKVIGPEHRLPVFTDRSQLPYIDYICYELLRWNPVTPLGLAHFITEDDVYKGYRIPKGTTVLPNVWAILHDPEMYPDPLAFDPERFSPENRKNGLNQLPDPAFGFGRRICPGKYLALDTLWIVVATVLTVYEISKEVDKHGKVKEPCTDFTPNSLSHPMPFSCTIVPRSSAARQLILQTEIQ
ncbi:cytochrome p450 [Favolaschia claudopus]|uniref:Cytochrome p450 n=1 Tax=Favolaschia claudopus TaxID=2862362 RepID=A0AAW0EF80_9AGAR